MNEYDKVKKRIYESFQNNLINTFNSCINSYDSYEQEFIIKCYYKGLLNRQFDFITYVISTQNNFKPDLSFHNFFLLKKLLSGSSFYFFQDYFKLFNPENVDFNEFIIHLHKEKKLTDYFINRIKNIEIKNLIHNEFKLILTKESANALSVNKELSLLFNIKNF